MCVCVCVCVLCVCVYVYMCICVYCVCACMHVNVLHIFCSCQPVLYMSGVCVCRESLNAVLGKDLASFREKRTLGLSWMFGDKQMSS